MGFFSELFGGGKLRALAKVKITAQGDNLNFDISTPNNKNLIILLTSYFTKVRWLIETEPELAMQRMKDHYDEVLNNYPNINNYNIFTPSAFGEMQVFDIEARKKGDDLAGVITTFSDDVGGIDLVDSCFVLLEEVFNRSNESDKELLFASLLKLKPLIFLDEMDDSNK